MAMANDHFGKRLALAMAVLLAIASRPLPGKTDASGKAPPAKGGFVIAPVIYYTPETRIAWGFVGIHYFRLFSSPQPSRLSSYRFNVIRTQNRQTTVQVDCELYLAGGRFLLDSTAKYSYYPNRFNGIGNWTTEAEQEDFTSRSWRLQLEPQLRLGGSVYAGLHLEAQSVSMRETQTGGTLEAGTVLGSAGGSINGVGLFAKWDSRDNTFSTSHGAYGAAFLNRYFGIFGGDYTYTQLALDARGYWPLGRGPVLAVQGIFKSVWGGCPFQALPMFGGLNLLRGYNDGRYRDRAMLALQGECRLPLGRRVGLCGFAGIAQVQEKISLLELDGFHAAAGGGVRYKFNPRENLVIRLDVGFAGAKPAFYLTFAEAF
jgi:outer membrane protein assembly factor BamA